MQLDSTSKTSRLFKNDNFALANWTSFAAGVAPKQLLITKTKTELINSIIEADKSKQEFIVIGEGSNILPDDSQFEGVVIIDRVSKTLDSEIVAAISKVSEKSFEIINSFVKLSGIPGTVSAAVVQNAGAYGVSISDFVSQVLIYLVDDNKEILLNKEECEFGYRTSIFKKSGSLFKNLTSRFVILDVKLNLLDTIHNSQLSAENRNLTQSLLTERNRIIETRNSKGMLAPWFGNSDSFKKRTEFIENSISNNPERFSTGSFFKNPEVPLNQFEQLKAEGILPKDTPYFELQDSEKSNNQESELVKIPAAFLIEAAGFEKGFSLEGASVAISPKHSLAIINLYPFEQRNQGRDARILAEKIQLKVKEKFRIELVPEVILL